MPATGLLLTGCAFLCMGCRQSTPLPGAVTGASMAPTLVGNNWRATCEDCGYPFRFDNSGKKGWPEKVVCPNCGFTGITDDDGLRQPPQKVRIQPAQTVSRWDVVAFRLPDGAKAGIKRVVGLPGENVDIRHGDLFVDGSILRKPFSLQQQMRIPIHDSRYVPNKNVQHRLRPMVAETDWVWTGSDWQYRPTEAIDLTHPDWLRYHHWRCFSHRGDREQDFPIEDNYGFNQAVARNLNKTDDLFFELQLTLTHPSCVGWRFFRGTTCHNFWLDPGKRELHWQVKSGEKWQTPIIIPVEELSAENVSIEFSSFDAQLIVAIDRNVVLEHALPPSYPPVSTYPLQIGGSGRGIHLRRFRLWRDVFYFPISRGQFQLAGDPEGYLLLGDNVPLSVDSRHWRPATIRTDMIFGVINRRSPESAD